jgi:hypothetical protein
MGSPPTRYDDEDFWAIFAHVSRSETVRLNTIAVSRESVSTQK